MPRAVIIAVGDLSLQPIKALTEKHNVNCASIQAVNTAAIANIDTLLGEISGNNVSAKEHGKTETTDCLFVHTQHGAFKQVNAFENIETLLVYSSPEAYLAQHLPAEPSEQTVQALLQTWQRDLHSALDVVEQNAAIKLCSLNDIIDNSPAFFKAVFNEAVDSNNNAQSTDIVQQVGMLTASALLVDNDELYELYDDALSVGTLFGEFTVHLSPDADTFKAAAHTLSALTQKFQDTLSRTTQLEKQFAESSEKLAAKCTEHETTQKKLSELTQQLNEDKAHFSKTLTELEQVRQQNVESDKVNASLKSELTAEREKLSASEQQRSELQAQLEAAVLKVNELQEVEGALKASAEKAAVLETQLATANSEAKVTQSKIAELQEELELATAKANKLEQAEANAKASSEKAAVLEAQLATANSEAKVTQSKMAELQEELELATAKANKLEQVEEDLNAAKVNIGSLKQKLATESEDAQLTQLQVAQLQEELELATSKANKLEQSEANAKASSEKAAVLEKQLATANSEVQLTQLQIAQLQEELELTFAKASKLEQAEAKTKASAEQVVVLEKQLATCSEEATLFQLQIAQLQEELESTFAQLQAAKNNEGNYQKNAEALVQSNNTTAKMADENTLLVNQLSQLQAELEQSAAEKQSLQAERDAMLSQQSKQNQTVSEGDEKLQNAEIELELASLQITQLQEELEHYYLALQQQEDAQNKGLVHSMMSSNQIQAKVFDKVVAEKVSITGQYVANDYQDIHLSLHNVAFPNGVSVECLKAKLIMVSGQVGIEFRAKEEQALFRMRDDATDEYGPYLRYFLRAPESFKAQQQHTIERLNASERLLIMGCVSTIAQLLQSTDIETTTNITPENWRLWRKAAIAFAQHVDTQPNWLSFDSVSLREEYVTDGYEHLWLIFNGVLLGNIWRNTLELKLTANAVGAASNGEFSDALNIEFRELEDGSAPLVTWPPEEADDYGPKLTLAINNLEPLNDLATQDSQLIKHLVNNLPSILEKLDIEERKLAHSKEAWASAAVKILNPSIEPTQQVDIAEEQPPEEHDRADVTLVCEEVVSAGSYQHIVFTQQGNNTKIKLRAENVNPDTFDAEVYVELRDGTNDVVYNESEFFGEDDYGPYVKIPAETLEQLKRAQNTTDLVWVRTVYQSASDSIDNAEEIDDLVKLLWKNVLSRKSEK